VRKPEAVSSIGVTIGGAVLSSLQPTVIPIAARAKTRAVPRDLAPVSVDAFTIP
jgi:hypothetical protein